MPLVIKNSRVNTLFRNKKKEYSDEMGEKHPENKKIHRGDAAPWKKELVKKLGVTHDKETNSKHKKGTDTSNEEEPVRRTTPVRS